MKKNRLLALLVLFNGLALALTGCGKPGQGKAGNPILMSFAPSGSVQEMVALGDWLAKTLSDRTGLVIQAHVDTDSAAVREAICAGKSPIGWLDTFNYVLAHEKCGVDVSLATVRFGAATYQGQIIVKADSGIKTLADLKGKVMCWVDLKSVPYYSVPRITLKASGLDPDTDFAKMVEAGSNHNVVMAVYNGECDAGATFVDARSAVQRDLPDVMDQVVVLATTTGIPNDGVDFAKDLPADMRDKIASALLDIAGTDEGKAALKTLYSIDGLQKVDDSFYDPFRADLSAAGLSVQDLFQK